jgi:putative copper resistance protein D
VTLVGTLARWIHLASAAFLVGTAVLSVLAGRPTKPTALGWQRQLGSALALAAGATLIAGAGVLLAQVVAIEGRATAWAEPASLGRVVGSTVFGQVWLVRHGLVLLLVVLTWSRVTEPAPGDWVVSRANTALLGGLVVALAAWAGHSARVEPWPVASALIDGLHAVLAAVWLGGLLPLACLLRAAARSGGADSRPFAVVAARRFSALALATIAALVATGAWNAWNQVGGVPALLGTPYGRGLLVKLGLVAAIIGVAGASRRWILPALAGESETVGRPAMRRLSLHVLLELAFGLALLGVVAWMTLTPPARHVPPSWPLPFRLSYGATRDLPGVVPRLLAGGVMVLFGIAGLGVARQVPWRWPGYAGAAAAIVLGGVVAVPALVVNAYPTTYQTPPVAYAVDSISAGSRLFGEACTACHAPDASDVLGPRVARHTAGDLYWWVTEGIPGTGMPGFGRRLSGDHRWDLVNLLRARAMARTAGALTASIEDRDGIVSAPDFVYAVGPTPPHSLREHRGRKIVLLVLFTLPESRERLDQLAGGYETLLSMGAEVIAVPADGDPGILRRLGPASQIFYPVVTDGGPDIVATYRLFHPPGAAPRHLELLIDRQGYLRARMAAFPGVLPGLSALLTQIEGLNLEPQVLEPAIEHVH